MLPQANLGTIKQSFRRLAHLYHPDKNQHKDQYNDARYRDIQEAYQVLSNTISRADYDNERWLNGQYKSSKTQAVTPSMLADEMNKLVAHLNMVDIYRMNHRSLADYMCFLLQDSHVAILKTQGNDSTIAHLIAASLQSLSYLNYELAMPIYSQLLEIVGNNKPQEKEKIIAEIKKRKRNNSLKKYSFWIVLLSTIILCLMVYMLSNR